MFYMACEIQVKLSQNTYDGSIFLRKIKIIGMLSRLVKYIPEYTV